jgi:hypothetical protein
MKTISVYKVLFVKRRIISVKRPILPVNDINAQRYNGTMAQLHDGAEI